MLWKEVHAVPPPHMEEEKFHSLSEAEREAYEEARMQEWEDAWNKTGHSQAERRMNASLKPSSIRWRRRSATRPR